MACVELFNYNAYVQVFGILRVNVSPNVLSSPFDRVLPLAFCASQVSTVAQKEYCIFVSNGYNWDGGEEWSFVFYNRKTKLRHTFCFMIEVRRLLQWR